MVELLLGNGEEFALPWRRAGRPAGRRARAIDRRAVGADGVHVEADQVAVVEHVRRRLAEVREGSLPRLEKPRDRELAACRDERSVELGPDLLLGAARLDRPTHRVGRRLGRHHRGAHRIDLCRLLDRHRELDGQRAVGDLDAPLAQRVDDHRFEPVGRERRTARSIAIEQRDDLVGEPLDLVAVAHRLLRRDRRRRPELVDTDQPARPVFAAGELPEDRRAAGHDQGEAVGTDEAVHRRVSAAGRVEIPNGSPLSSAPTSCGRASSRGEPGADARATPDRVADRAARPAGRRAAGPRRVRPARMAQRMAQRMSQRMRPSAEPRTDPVRRCASVTRP